MNNFYIKNYNYKHHCYRTAYYEHCMRVFFFGYHWQVTSDGSTFYFAQIERGKKDPLTQ